MNASADTSAAVAKEQTQARSEQKETKQSAAEKLEIRFKRFGSIENATREKSIEAIALAGYADKKIQWVATEKVHGANFSFCTDGQSIEIYKRTGVVKPDELFYDCRAVRDKYREDILRVFRCIKESETHKHCTTVTIYGELFGGMYPHKDVKPIPGVKHVQKFLWYAPWCDFYGFDISVDHRSYLPFDEADGFFKQAKVSFLCAEPLKIGTLNELLKFDVEKFNTTLPSRLGLPPIDNDQVAEGVIIKPLCITPYVGGERAIIKLKAERFLETQKSKKAPKAKKQQTAFEFDDKVETLAEEARAHVTLNRVRNMISKIGSVTKKELPRLVGLTTADVLEELGKDHEEVRLWKHGSTNSGKMNYKRLNGIISKEVGELVGSNRLAILSDDL